MESIRRTVRCLPPRFFEALLASDNRPFYAWAGLGCARWRSWGWVVGGDCYWLAMQAATRDAHQFGQRRLFAEWVVAAQGAVYLAARVVERRADCGRAAKTRAALARRSPLAVVRLTAVVTLYSRGHRRAACGVVLRENGHRETAMSVHVLHPTAPSDQ